MHRFQFTLICGVKKMNKCEKCGVNVYESEKRCPLCHSEMLNVNETNVQYPKYKDIIKEKSPLKSIPLFVSTAIIIISIYINIFTYGSGEVFWAFIVSASVLYLFAMFKLTRSTKKHGAKALLSYIFISLFLTVIDFTAGMLLWSVNYVLPFLTLAITVYLTALAVRSKTVFSEYFGYILVVIAIDIATTILDLLILKNPSWGTFMTVVSCLIIALVLYLFADKSLKNEVRKRFHR